jgi:hypothetical protein
MAISRPASVTDRPSRAGMFSVALTQIQQR